MDDVNLVWVVDRGVRSEIVDSKNKASRMAYPYSLAKNTISSPCVILVHVETTSSLILFTLNNKILNLDTKIPSIAQTCIGRFLIIPYTWISVTQNTKFIFDVRHGNDKCCIYLR